MTGVDDKRIVDMYLERDERAIKHSEEKYGSYLYRIAYNILECEEDCKESVNDTYLAAWRSIPPQCPADLRSYLAKLTRRISIDLYRRKSRTKRKDSQYALSLSELEELSGGDMPEEEIEARLLAEAISRFLRTQSDEARRLFVGRYYYLDPLKTVADYCGMSESKAKSMLFRTRRALGEFLKKEGFDI